MRYSNAAFLVLAIVSVNAFAQTPAGDVILPGDARVDGSFIHSVTNAWKMTGTSVGGSKTDGGVWKDKIELVEREGQKIIRRSCSCALCSLPAT